LAYRSSFVLADELGARSIALPAISAGIYGYPTEEAARVALDTARQHLLGPTDVERATWVLFSDATFDAFQAALERLP
jgi:O-acetyl-ADP-ribose deacetylase (regulator of RNase III)